MRVMRAGERAEGQHHAGEDHHGDELEGEISFHAGIMRLCGK